MPMTTPRVCLSVCAHGQTKEAARKAIQDFNGTQFQGKVLEVNLSEDNRRLLLSGVDWRWTKEDVKMHLNPFLRNVRGLVDLELRDFDYTDPRNK